MPYDFRVTKLDINLTDKLRVMRVVSFYYPEHSRNNAFYTGRVSQCEGTTERLLGYFSWDDPESEIWDNRRK